jgi:glycosidase
MKRFWSLLLAACLLALAGCAPAQQPQGDGYPRDPATGEILVQGVGAAVPNETNDRVFYQVFVGSFSDSNGDGVGDLRGLINRFDYLNDGDPNSGKSLGVEGIWLNPIFLSPSYHKYDTVDYYAIDHRFGTEADLRELIQLCHERGVKIILDLVINHTSNKHTWFQQFCNAHQNGDTSSPYYEFYTYADAPISGRTFQPISGSKDYYECNFSGDMPELNFDNPVVRQEMVTLARTYLDMGVDGFRFDAAKYVYYGDEAKNAEFWDWYMAELRAIKPDIYSVAEVWDADTATFPYFTSTNCFNFTMSQQNGQIAKAAKGGSVSSLTYYMEQYLTQIKEKSPNAMPVTFISNHDMDRAAGFLQPGFGHAQMAANLSILLPGSSFIYYGEEIGMLGSRGGSSTDANRRLAMLWGDADTVRDPVGSNYKGEQANGTVADQLGQADSLYNHYKKVIAIRKANPEIASGTFIPLDVSGSKAGGFLSTLNGKSVAVFHNTTTEPVQIDLSKYADFPCEALAAFVGMGEATLEGNILTLAGQTTAILR